MASFALLDGGYAKTANHVYFQGKAVKGADAASFAMVEKYTGAEDARDRNATYRHGERTKPQ